MRITKIELLNQLNDKTLSYIDKIHTLDLLFDFNFKSSTLFILSSNQFLTYDIINYVKDIKNYRLLNELKSIFKCFSDLYSCDKFDIAFKYIKQIDNYKILKFYKVLIFNIKHIPNDEYEYILNEALNIKNADVLNEFNTLVSKLYYSCSDTNHIKKIVHYAAISNNKLFSLVIYRYMIDNLDLLNDDILLLYLDVFNKVKSCDLIYYNEYLFTNYNLIISEYYGFVLENALKINSILLCKSFGALACNLNLLESSYYQYTLSKALKTKNEDKINFIIRILDNHDIKYILASDNYPIVINTIMKVHELNILNYLYPLFCNKYAINAENYHNIIKYTIKMINSELSQNNNINNVENNNSKCRKRNK